MANDIAIMVVVMNLQVVLVVDKACFSADESCQDPLKSAKSITDEHLSGRLDFSTRQSGEILINGHKQKLSYGTSVRN